MIVGWALAQTAPVTLDTLEVSGTLARLVLSCEPAPCGLFVETAPDRKVRLETLDAPAGAWSVQRVDDRWLVGEGPGMFTVDWSQEAALGPGLRVWVHLEVGYEHVSDRRHLVDLAALRTLWTEQSPYRMLGSHTVSVESVAGAPALVTLTHLRRDALQELTDQVSASGWRLVEGAAQLEPMPPGTVPLWAVVVASHPSPLEAEAAARATPCLADLPLLASSTMSRWAPGLAVHARVTTSEAKATTWLEAARACRPDAFVKRAR